MTLAELFKNEGKAEGFREGNAVGRAEAVLSFLAARGLPVSDSLRTQILACRDATTIEQWIVRAVSVTAAEDILHSTEPQTRSRKGAARRTPKAARKS